ncbi:MAG: hypothetical protein HC926_04035 [Synechococcaceae cyanobacterium SM2_3_60]|nr:hypothetical protein [Synechococcaceae cyanobacterium SM2_3_60]
MLAKILIGAVLLVFAAKVLAGFLKKDWPIVTLAITAIWVSFIGFELVQLGRALWVKFGA